MLTALAGVAGLLLIALVLGLLAGMSRHGTLPPNGTFGIRTRATRASEAAWREGHRAAARRMKLAVWIALLCAALVMATAILLPTTSEAGDLPVFVVLMFSYGLLVVCMLFIARAANKAARRAQREALDTA